MYRRYNHIKLKTIESISRNNAIHTTSLNSILHKKFMNWKIKLRI